MAGIGVPELLVLALVVIIVGAVVALVVRMTKRVSGGLTGKLVRCAACGGTVSARATACPNCGEPR